MENDRLKQMEGEDSVDEEQKDLMERFNRHQLGSSNSNH